jgi:uncharacterized protein with HEPN domain
MSKLDDETRLQHMLDAAAKANTFIQNRCRADLDTDEMLALALVKLLEIIGEAGGRISAETQAQLPQIPWGQIVAMRNRLTHAYFDVDLDIIWVTVATRLEPLIEQIEQYLQK